MEKVYEFEFVGGTPEGVTTAQLGMLLEAAKRVALEGLPRIWGHEYEDDHITVRYSDGEITVMRKREDEAGQPITEVMNLYQSDKSEPYRVYTLRPGAWMYYLITLDALLDEADAEADHQGMKMMDYAFKPVQDDDALKDVTPGLRERPQAEYDAADMRVELRRVHLKMNRIMKALGIEDYWNVE